MKCCDELNVSFCPRSSSVLSYFFSKRCLHGTVVNGLQNRSLRPVLDFSPYSLLTSSDCKITETAVAQQKNTPYPIKKREHIKKTPQMVEYIYPPPLQQSCSTLETEVGDRGYSWTRLPFGKSVCASG